jgi:hypothetical protein
MLDIGYRIKVYSNIRYNVGLRSLQSDIGSSDIQLSLILLITDIGLSAHLGHLCTSNADKEILKSLSTPLPTKSYPITLLLAGLNLM